MRLTGRVLALVALAASCLVPATTAWAAGGLDPTYGSGSLSVYTGSPPVPSGKYRNGQPLQALVSPRGVVYVPLELRNCLHLWEGPDCHSLAAVSRYWPDGSLDHDFGTGGMLVLPRPQPDRLGVDAEGRLLTATERRRSETALVRRYTGTGAADDSFGRGGRAIARGVTFVNTLEPAGGGRILLGGTNEAGSFDAFALARLLPDGRQDRKFGRGGHAVFHLDWEFEKATVAPGGAIYLTGVFCCKRYAAISRISAAGRTDTRFDQRSRAAQIRALTRIDEPTIGAVVPRADGEVDLLGGTEPTFGGGRESGFALRLHADGSIDLGFGHHGLRPLPAPVLAAAAGRRGTTFLLSLQAEPGPAPGRVTGRRLFADGELDAGFGTNGKVVLPGIGWSVEAKTLAAGGALVSVAGYRECPETCQPAPYLVRLIEGNDQLISIP